MKRFLHLLSAAAVAAAISVCVAPSLVKDEAITVAGLWTLARPAQCVPSDFYFSEKQWLADARSVVAAVQFLWEIRQSSSSIPAPSSSALAAAEMPLLTHANIASDPPPADPT